MAHNVQDKMINDTCIGLIKGRKKFVDTFENDDKNLFNELIIVNGFRDEIDNYENYPQYNKKAKLRHVILEIGMEFLDLDKFKGVIRDYNINLRRLVSF